MRHGRNAKSQILSFENLRGIVRQAKVVKSANSVVTDSSGYVAKADSSSKIFQLQSLSLFHFLLCRITTEAMGIWRFAGAFAVVKRQSECGSKTAGMHVSQPMPIGVCYGFVASFFPVVFLFSCLNAESMFVFTFMSVYKKLSKHENVIQSQSQVEFFVLFLVV